MNKTVFTLLLTLVISVSANALIGIDVAPTTQNQDVVRQMDQGTYWFGRVTVHSRNTARYTVTNTGDEDLEYASAKIWGAYFDAYHNCTGILKPKERCQFEIVYWPGFTGIHSGDFALNFTQESIRIHVWGEAVERF